MSLGQALVRAHLAVFFMSITGVLAKVSGFDAWHVTSYRVCLGGLVLFMLWHRDEGGPLPLGRSLACVAMGALLSVHWYTFFLSLELLGIMLGYAMTGLQPLFIAILARVMLGEGLERRTLLSLVVALCGFALLGLDAGPTPRIWWGITVAVLSYALFALLVLFNRTQVRHLSALRVTALEMFGAIPLTLVMTLPDWAPSQALGWLWAVLLGVVCTGLAYVTYNASMKVLTAPVAGLLLSLEVVYGFAGGLLIGDRLSAVQWLAALLIANILFADVGRYLWTRAGRRGQDQGSDTSATGS
jgi:drug/metabolite transporter (DMT)-like permease